MNYTLNNYFTRSTYTITVVGCGGTGGFVAESLCRILPPYVKLVLIDFDRVEERNLSRQNFFREDLGKVKSEALAARLSDKYNRPVAYSVAPIALIPTFYPGLVLGCVDNGLARQDIAKHVLVANKGYYNSKYFWIDAGNGENFGQVLIGNSDVAVHYYESDSTGKVLTLPLPTIQRPDLLTQAPPVRVDCTQNADQNPTINQSMAALMVEVVRRMIAGTCPWMQLYLDMEAGTLTPVYIQPPINKKSKEKRR